jgi:hypothetical protein
VSSTDTDRGLIVAKDKSASPTWADVRAFLLTFDPAGLQGLIQDLYAASGDNQAFLHARFGLGLDQLRPYKATISRWINPDLMKNETVSVSKAKKAIADYRKAIGRPGGFGGAVGILLRGGIQLRRRVQLQRCELFCCSDPHV